MNRQPVVRSAVKLEGCCAPRRSRSYSDDGFLFCFPMRRVRRAGSRTRRAPQRREVREPGRARRDGRRARVRGGQDRLAERRRAGPRGRVRLDEPSRGERDAAAGERGGRRRDGVARRAREQRGEDGRQRVQAVGRRAGTEHARVRFARPRVRGAAGCGGSDATRRERRKPSKNEGTRTRARKNVGSLLLVVTRRASAVLKHGSSRKD